MASATLVGGEFVKLSLNPSEYHVARDALAALGQGFSSSHVIHNAGIAPGAPGPLYVYNIPGGGPTFHLPAGAQAVVLKGNAPQRLVGHGGTEVLIGNQGSDTFVAGGGSGTMIGGDGGNLFRATGGSFKIVDGVGQDTVKLNGGVDTVVTIGGHDIVEISGTNLTATGQVDVIGHGSDTIALGPHGGRDSVVEAGSATVSGVGNFIFDATQSHGSESVTAGSGHVTMLGGHGTNVFIGGSGFQRMVAGTGSTDTFAGGSGDSFMDAKNAHVVFQFDTSHALGSHTIANFAHGNDKLNLIGYDSNAALAGAHISNGNTVIALDGGATRIVLKGFTGLNAGDFS